MGRPRQLYAQYYLIMVFNGNPPVWLYPDF